MLKTKTDKLEREALFRVLTPVCVRDIYRHVFPGQNERGVRYYLMYALNNNRTSDALIKGDNCLVIVKLKTTGSSFLDALKQLNQEKYLLRYHAKNIKLVIVTFDRNTINDDLLSDEDVQIIRFDSGYEVIVNQPITT